MKFVVGIDSGGTKNRLKALSLDGTTLGYQEGKNASIYHLSFEKALENTEENITNLLSSFNGKREDIMAVAVGTTGYDSEEDGVKLRKLYKSLKNIDCPILVMNDAELAHYAVTGGEGILALSGTGSICFAKRRDGKSVRTGGWLFSILGDEGSGAWVSRAALRVLGRFFDGAMDETLLIKKLKAETEIENRDGLNMLAKKMATPPWPNLKLGRIVDDAAEEGDEDAINILKEAALLLFKIFSDAERAIELEKSEKDFRYGIWGSNIKNSRIMKETFLALVKERYKDSIYIEGGKEAVDAASDLALKMVRNTN